MPKKSLKNSPLLGSDKPESASVSNLGAKELKHFRAFIKATSKGESSRSHRENVRHWSVLEQFYPEVWML